MIIAVDFDGTLFADRFPSIGRANVPLIRYLVKRKTEGDTLILWTCRTGKALVDAVFLCAYYGLWFDKVNDDSDANLEVYGPGGRKIFADRYIDDRAGYKWGDIV